MQTFLPYPDFPASAAVLDQARLGKQRVEALQILRALTLPDYGWQRHPAVRMWMGHVPALVAYGLAMADEWVRRGRPDSTGVQIAEFAPAVADGQQAEPPPWLGDPGLHLSHRSNLIRKEPEFYRERFPGVPADLPYVWPEPRQVLLPGEPEGEREWVWRGNVVLPRQDGRTSISMQRHRANGKPSRKWDRQLAAFSRDLAEGEPVALLEPGTGDYLSGVAGPLVAGDEGSLQRDIELTGRLQRTDFDHPALLQDPRTFFAVPARQGLQRH